MRFLHSSQHRAPGLCLFFALGSSSPSIVNSHRTLIIDSTRALICHYLLSRASKVRLERHTWVSLLSTILSRFAVPFLSHPLFGFLLTAATTTGLHVYKHGLSSSYLLLFCSLAHFVSSWALVSSIQHTALPTLIIASHPPHNQHYLSMRTIPLGLAPRVQITGCRHAPALFLPRAYTVSTTSTACVPFRPSTARYTIARP